MVFTSAMLDTLLCQAYYNPKIIRSVVVVDGCFAYYENVTIVVQVEPSCVVGTGFDGALELRAAPQYAWNGVPHDGVPYMCLFSPCPAFCLSW